MGTARYSEEFKRDAATLVESSGWRISSLARERDVNPESLRQWIARSRAAASPSGTGGECPLHQEEREELRRLCKEDALDTLRTLLFEFDSRSPSGTRNSCTACWRKSCGSSKTSTPTASPRSD
ncbi:transposase [Streptomyces alfalfae]|uniref:transposase n=1 Tax=Streptomyces alfalfae TaxID=1642299 RepID=UPI003CC812D4